MRVSNEIMQIDKTNMNNDAFCIMLWFLKERQGVYTLSQISKIIKNKNRRSHDYIRNTLQCLGGTYYIGLLKTNPYKIKLFNYFDIFADVVRFQISDELQRAQDNALSFTGFDFKKLRKLGSTEASMFYYFQSTNRKVALDYPFLKAIGSKQYSLLKKSGQKRINSHLLKNRLKEIESKLDTIINVDIERINKTYFLTFYNSEARHLAEIEIDWKD